MATPGTIERAIEPGGAPGGWPLPAGALGRLGERDGARIIARLFYRLAALYGAQWQNQFIGDDTMAQIIKAEWRHRLRGLTPERIAIGIERLDQRPGQDRRFVPGVLEFVDLCRPDCEELGVPGKWVAYRQAIAQRYTHPMVAHVHVNIGRERMAEMRSGDSSREWSAAYDAAFDAARNGYVFDWPQGTGGEDRKLAHRTPAPASARIARAFIAQIKGKKKPVNHG